MSNSNGDTGAPRAGLSKYQAALQRLKGEPETAPDFADEPATPEPVAAPASEPPAEDSDDNVLSFLDEIAAEHGLTDTPATAEAAPSASETGPTPPASEIEVAPPVSEAEPTPPASEIDVAPPVSEAETESAAEAPPLEAESPAKASDAAMDAYLNSLSKLKTETAEASKSQEKAEEEDQPLSSADALEVARDMMQDADGTGDRKVDKRYQRATERLKERSSVKEAAENKKPRRVPALKGVLHGEDDDTPCAPEPRRRKGKAEAKAAAGGSRLAELPPIALQAGVGFAILVLGLLLQFGIYQLLGTPFVLRDLAAGLSAVLPAGLILALAAPETDRDWRAVMASAAALGLTASLAFALCMAVTYSAPLAGTHIVVVVFLQLGILTMLLGPVILAVAAWLNHLELITLTDPLYE